jgi:hypothetical protein
MLVLMGALPKVPQRRTYCTCSLAKQLQMAYYVVFLAFLVMSFRVAYLMMFIAGLEWTFKAAYLMVLIPPNTYST